MKNNIKFLREEKGFTQEEISIKANISVRQYRRIEQGEQDPRTKTSILLAKALHTSVEKLFSSS